MSQETDPKSQEYLKARILQLDAETAKRGKAPRNSSSDDSGLSPALILLLLVLVVSVAALGYMLTMPIPH